MAIYNGGRASIARRPIGANRQTKLVDLPSGLAVERKLPYCAGAATDHFLFQASVRDRELPSIQPEVTAKFVQKFRQGLAKAPLLALQLINGLLQAVRDSYFPTREPSPQLAIMVALDSIGGPGSRHAHRYPQGIWRVRPAVDDVAYEDHFPAVGRRDFDGSVPAVVDPLDAIAEFGQKSLELVGAAMDVADNVKRAVVIALICPEGLTRYRGGFDAVDAGKFPDLTETLALKSAETSAHFRHHPLHHLPSEGAVRPPLVALDANLDTRIEYNGDRQGMPSPSEFDPALPIGRAHIGGVDDSYLPVLEPLANDLAHQVERIAGHALIGFVIGNQSAAIIG